MKVLSAVLSCFLLAGCAVASQDYDRSVPGVRQYELPMPPSNSRLVTQSVLADCGDGVQIYVRSYDDNPESMAARAYFGVIRDGEAQPPTVLFVMDDGGDVKRYVIEDGVVVDRTNDVYEKYPQACDIPGAKNAKKI